MRNRRRSAIRAVLDQMWTDRHGMPVAAWVADRREVDGMSWRQIADEFALITGQVPSHTMLYRWYHEQKTDERRRGAA